MSELMVRMGAWSACKASCLSCWSGVEHTWQQLTLASWLAGVWSCSNRKVAYPGSCGVNTEKTEALAPCAVHPYKFISNTISQPVLVKEFPGCGLLAVWSLTALWDPHCIIRPLPGLQIACLFRPRCCACMQTEDCGDQVQQTWARLAASAAELGTNKPNMRRQF